MRVEGVAPAGPGVTVAHLAPTRLDADGREMVAHRDVVGVVLLGRAAGQRDRWRTGGRPARREHAGHEAGHLAPVLEPRLLRVELAA